MSSKIALTTGDVAAHCLISADTVINWIKEKKLKAYTTPGGHRRIHVSDFKVFLNEYNLPPYPEDVLETRKVLVVDDEPKVVELITNCLGMTDQYELATAADGFDAGLQVSKFNPNLIILDLMMPNIDGFNVCKRIKSSSDTSHIRILVITGYGTDENIQKALACGADDYLEKPFQLNELVKKVEELIHRKQADSATSLST